MYPATWYVESGSIGESESPHYYSLIRDPTVNDRVKPPRGAAKTYKLHLLYQLKVIMCLHIDSRTAIGDRLRLLTTLITLFAACSDQSLFTLRGVVARMGSFRAVLQYSVSTYAQLSS